MDEIYETVKFVLWQKFIDSVHEAMSIDEDMVQQLQKYVSDYYFYTVYNQTVFTINKNFSSFQT